MRKPFALVVLLLFPAFAWADPTDYSTDVPVSDVCDRLLRGWNLHVFGHIVRGRGGAE